MTQGIDGARALIESRLREIKEEAAGLERALVSLGESPSTPSTGTSKPRRRKGASRAPRGRRREQFLAAVKSKPGSTAAEVGKAMGVSTNQAYGLGKRLTDLGMIKKSGKGFRLANQR